MTSRKLRGIIAVALGCIGYGTVAFSSIAVASPQIAMVTPLSSMHHVFKNTAAGRAKVFQARQNATH
jgi:hypothetical protein